MGSKKNSTNEVIYKTETDIENKHNGYQRKRWRHKLLIWD